MFFFRNIKSGLKKQVLLCWKQSPGSSEFGPLHSKEVVGHYKRVRGPKLKSTQSQLQKGSLPEMQAAKRPELDKTL